MKKRLPKINTELGGVSMKSIFCASNYAWAWAITTTVHWTPRSHEVSRNESAKYFWNVKAMLLIRIVTFKNCRTNVGQAENYEFFHSIVWNKILTFIQNVENFSRCYIGLLSTISDLIQLLLVLLFILSRNNVSKKFSNSITTSVVASSSSIYWKRIGAAAWLGKPHISIMQEGTTKVIEVDLSKGQKACLSPARTHLKQLKLRCDLRKKKFREEKSRVKSCSNVRDMQ